jgi:hypothetical protein
MTIATKIHREEKLTGRKSRSAPGAEISLGNLVATRGPAQKMARLTEKDLLRRLKAGRCEAAKYPARKN